MTITALKLITSSMRLVLAGSSGETLDADEANDALDVLNELLSSWALRNLMSYRNVNSEFSLVAGTQSYTIGPSGAFNTDRPVSIEGAFVTSGDVDYPLRLLSTEEWNSIAQKSSTSPIPTAIYYDSSYPLGTIWVWPAPSDSIQITLSVNLQFAALTSLAQSISYPPGYSKALRYNLAVELAPEYGLNPPESVLGIAREEIAAIKTANRQMQRSYFDSALGGGDQYGSIGFAGGSSSGSGGSSQTCSDATISMSDITTNDVSISKHGFAPKAPNDATQFLNGLGLYSVPAGTGGAGSGTVTSVSVVTANGVSGSVATATTTPAITLSLGAITPTTVNGVTLSGSSTPTLAVTGTTTVAGANTGDQTITLTGDVTGAGTGSFAATIANDAVTYAKMQNVSATDKVLGRSTSGAGNVEEIACTAAGRALIDDADASAQRTTLGLGTLATQSGTFSGTSSGTNTGDQTITLTGDVTGAGTGSFAATIANDAVTYAKMQNVSATDKVLGRSTSGAGNVEEIACTAAGRALIDDADASAQRTTLGLGTLATQSGTFSGTSSGTNTGDQTSVSGNAGTATTLATSRNIDGQAFNGSADVTVIAPGTHAASSKATPADADEVPLVDSAASNVLKRLTWANLKAAIKPPAVALTDGATISLDISTGEVFDVTIAGDRTINFTGGAAALDGKRIVIRIKQDGTGTRLITWGTGARFGTDITSVTLTTAPSKTDYVGVIYNHASTSFDVVSLTKGF